MITGENYLKLVAIDLGSLTLNQALGLMESYSGQAYLQARLSEFLADCAVGKKPALPEQAGNWAESADSNVARKRNCTVPEMWESAISGQLAFVRKIRRLKDYAGSPKHHIQ